MIVRRCGNFGFIDTGAGQLFSFQCGERLGTGFDRTSYMISGPGRYNYMSVLGERIIPFGADNDLPGYVRRVMERFYAGEGIMGKKIGLQWGEGPRLYRDADDGAGVSVRQWVRDPAVEAELRRSDYLTQMHRCLVDLVHLEGFWVKFTRNRAPRVGGAGRLLGIEHLPASRCRFIFPGSSMVRPSRVMVAEFPVPSADESRIYPVFDPADPFRHPEAVAYYSLYSFGHEDYSVPRFVGAFDWLELAGSLAGILATYNENASAISLHIKSPQSYWDNARDSIKRDCEQRGVPYSEQMLEDFKEAAMEKFAEHVSGRENAGKFTHTSVAWNTEAQAFEGWEVIPVDKKIKDYIEAQVAIARKSEAAATSGFGLDPALSNLILDTKLGSGSEKLYSLKVYNASETALPDMVLCKPWQQMIEANHPGTDLRLGLCRRVVDAEANVNPENRVKANA